MMKITDIFIQGIGLATSQLLAARGCRVIIADKDVSETAKQSILAETGNPNVISIYLDLSSFRSIRKFAENIKKSEKKIDILINNAGIGGSPIKKSDDGNNNVMQTNFFGAFLLTHLILGNSSYFTSLESKFFPCSHDEFPRKVKPNTENCANTEKAFLDL